MTTSTCVHCTWGYSYVDSDLSGTCETLFSGESDFVIHGPIVLDTDWLTPTDNASGS